MPANLLTHITSAQHKLHDGFLGRWQQSHRFRCALDETIGSLLGTRAPQEFVFVPKEPWAGNAEHGKWLVQGGVFSLEGDQLTLHGEEWEPFGVADRWIAHIHSFAWLRDLRALGGDLGRKGARAMLLSWIDHYGQWNGQTSQSITWRPDVMGTRLANWIACYEFYGESASDELQEKIFDSLHRQLRYLEKSVSMPTASSQDLYALPALKGLIYAGLALEDKEALVEKALELLDKHIYKQILSDGGHITRSPKILCDSVQLLIDVRSALKQAGQSCPLFLQNALDRSVQALRSLRHGDRYFVTMNGAGEGSLEGDAERVQTILFQAGSKARALRHLPHMGYERLTCGKSLVIVDVGKSPRRPFDANCHGAPLSFEWSFSRERVFVSCGTHPTDTHWQDALRNTAAHNTLTIDDRNAVEFGSDGHVTRSPQKITLMRDDKDRKSLLEASHDGYVPVNGMTHRRRLFLSEGGHDLRGEDNLHCALGMTRDHAVSVRFHLHPDVKVSLIKGGVEALMRLKSGTGFRFSLSGGALSLEDSIYLGTGTRPRKTKQLVITSPMQDDTLQIKWAVRRESQ